MAFIQETIEKSMSIWIKCYESHFVQELGKGILPSAKFRNYIIQDSLYLKNYARIFGKAIYNASTLREMQIYFSLLEFLAEEQYGVRLGYLEDTNMTREQLEAVSAWPENQAYIDFLSDVAENGSNREILMSVLPCMLSYYYVFSRLVNETPEIEKTKYAGFISGYIGDAYHENNNKVIAFMEEFCADANAAEKEKLESLFYKASQHELAFWLMAYQPPEES